MTGSLDFPTFNHLTGLALADALYERGLVPPKIHCIGPADHAQRYVYFLYGQFRIWRPWQSYDAVAHLIERFEINIGKSFGRWYVYHGFNTTLPRATDFAGLPATIARLALRLHALQQQEVSP